MPSSYRQAPDSDLVAILTETNSVFTISRAYEDHRDLLTRIKTEIPDGGGGTNVVSQYDYVYGAYIYDSIGLRTSVVNDGAAFGGAAEHNIWGYNDRAELASSYRYVGSNPSTTTNEVAAERRSYVYDPIANRQYAYVGSSPYPDPAYSANNLNQYTATTNPDVELFDYDEDGNMTEDGTFEYTWNGENRLIQVEPKTPASGDLRLTFAYDFMGRRVQKVEEEYDGSSWSTNAVTKFVWDGWLLIAELDGMDSDTLTRTYTWGLDLSGTFQGAGGIGGLLMVDDDTGDGFCGYFAYDGNGNVGQVLDAEDLSTDAHYEYDPYGREIVATGTYADDNLWRFSTKYLDVLDPNDADASLLYFGHRYLSPRLGRWMSTDPIGAAGGRNVYAFSVNSPPNRRDSLGLKGSSAKSCTTCGPEVEEALRETKAIVERDYQGLAPEHKEGNCYFVRTSLWDMPIGEILWAGTQGWDLKELVGDKDSPGAVMPGCPEGKPCQETVTVRGRCFNRWTVNYVSYGWINRLCGVSMKDMETRILMYKVPKELDANIVEQAIAWAKAGYHGFPDGAEVPWSDARYDECGRCYSGPYAPEAGDLRSMWPHLYKLPPPPPPQNICPPMPLEPPPPGVVH